MSDEENKKGDDDEVGYGRPPKRTQFKKGQSGNTNGRPKASVSNNKRIENMLEERTLVKKGDRVRTLSTFEVGLARLAEKARKGDSAAIGRIIALARDIEKGKAANAAPLERALEPLTEEEEAIALDFLLRQKALREAF